MDPSLAIAGCGQQENMSQSPLKAKQYGSGVSLWNAPVVQKLAIPGAGRRSQIGDASNQEKPLAKPAPAILPDLVLHLHTKGEPLLTSLQAHEVVACSSSNNVVVHPEAPIFSKVRCVWVRCRALDSSYHKLHDFLC